jgi:hypothetical protein
VVAAFCKKQRRLREIVKDGDSWMGSKEFLLAWIAGYRDFSKKSNLFPDDWLNYAEFYYFFAVFGIEPGYRSKTNRYSQFIIALSSDNC